MAAIGHINWQIDYRHEKTPKVTSKYTKCRNKSPCLPLRGRWHGASRDGEGKAAGGNDKLALSVCFADSSPKGRAKNAAEEPLPPTLGEVASRRDDGEGKNAAEKPSPVPGKRRKPTLFAAIKRSFTEAKKMWQNRYKNIAKYITRFTKDWGQLLYKVQKNGTKSAVNGRKSQKVSIWTLAI